VALGAESTGQLEIARQAWGATRGAALETRHFVTPRELDLERANASLARLAGVSDATGAAREKMAKVLARDDAPQAPWVLLLGAGFALFTAGIVSFVSSGVARSGEVSRRAVWVSAVVTAAGVACWALAVLRA